MRVSLLTISVVFACVSFAAPSPIHLNGEVLIQNNGPRTVFAFVNPGRGADLQILRISADKPFPQNPVSLVMSKAQVTVEADRMTLYDGEAKVIVVFALHGVVVTEAPEGFEQIVLRGHWLGRLSGVRGLTIAALKRDRNVVAEFCDASHMWFDCQDDGGGGFGNGSGGGVSCQSGGRGASSCSCASTAGNCSVTCNSGTYACCRNCDTNVPSCTCIAN
jgi:hypothetical protein